MSPSCYGIELTCFGVSDAQPLDDCNYCNFVSECDKIKRNRSLTKQTPAKEKVKDMSHQVQKTFSVCTAHRLMDHPGACKNLHGHNYNITVYFEAEELNSQGMVIDFGAIKDVAGKMIDNMYDHKTVLQDTDELVGMLSVVLQTGTVVTMPCPPTAENMAKQVFHNVQIAIGLTCGVKVVRVDVEETKNSIAIYVE